MKNYDQKLQTDTVILDFRKSFDTFLHRKILSKLDHYGIKGSTLNWITTFLTDRNQQVAVEGGHSKPVKVESVVPQDIA